MPSPSFHTVFIFLVYEMFIVILPKVVTSSFFLYLHIFRTAGWNFHQNVARTDHDAVAAAKLWRGAAVPTVSLQAALEVPPLHHEGEALRLTP